MIEARDLRKEYKLGKNSVQALSRVNLTVSQGERLALLGPSGSGKSTVLSIIGGIETPTAGTVAVNGKNLNFSSEKEMLFYRRRSVGFVFQRFHLSPVLSAMENVIIPAILNGVEESRARREAKALLKLVGLSGKADSSVDTLSGGQRQRVAIVRALIHQPKILLADEPTANLDSESSECVLQNILQMSLERGCSVVWVTHDNEQANRFDRIVRIANGELLPPEPVGKLISMSGVVL